VGQVDEGQVPYMKRTTVAIAVALISLAANGLALDVIPRPERDQARDGEFVVNRRTRISIVSAGERLNGPARLLAGYVKEGRGLDLSIAKGEKAGDNVIVLDLMAEDAGLGDEGYVLDITPRRVNIAAGSECGIVYGIQSLRQMTDASASLPCVSIRDKPRYPWRGLMLDEARHFFGKEEIKRLLDRMAYYKLNRFHWHLTDSPGWRIEIKKYPRLATVGGRGCDSDKEAPVRFYAQRDITEIIEYARVRQIVIIPEIDMPGHATAANRAYPEHSGGGSSRRPHFTFNPGKEGTYGYLSDILAETAGLFPGPWLHFGGDEAHFGNKKWNTLPEVQERMKKENFTKLLEIEHYFNRRMADVIESLGKTTIGWDEVTESGVTPKQAIVMWWRHNKKSTLDNALEKGFRVVLCPRVPCYFDFVQHSSHRSGRRWKGKFGDLRKVHAFPDSLIEKYGKARQSQIMGIQTCVWTERIKEVRRLEFMTFPRLAALAESAWTTEENKDYGDFLVRLKTHLKQYDKWGIYYFNPFHAAAVKEPIGP